MMFKTREIYTSEDLPKPSKSKYTRVDLLIIPLVVNPHGISKFFPDPRGAMTIPYFTKSELNSLVFSFRAGEIAEVKFALMLRTTEESDFLRKLFMEDSANRDKLRAKNRAKRRDDNGG